MITFRTSFVFLLVCLFATTAFGEALMVNGSVYGGDWLNLEQVSTSIEVSDQVITTVIDQTFMIPVGSSEASYFYPLPEQATVTGFGYWQDGEVHYYPLEPGAQGGGGGGNLPYWLSEYLGENLFTQTFEDLPPGLRTIRLEYTELMQYDFGINSFTYNLQMPPNLLDPIGLVDIEISGTSQRDLTSISVNDYPVDFDYFAADSLHGTFVGEMLYPDLPFHVEIEVDQEDVGLWLMSYREVDTIDPGFFLAVIEPGDVTQNQVITKNFTFVIDRSGSMSGQPILEAKQAAEYCVNHLEETDLFNIITFNSSVLSWESEPVQATPDNVADAISFINAIYAGGSTALNDAVLTALNQPMDQNQANQILLLSDGLPTYGETYLPAILDNIDGANTLNASIFSVAAGPAADLAFLNYIAYMNSGLAHVVEDVNNMSEEIELFFQRFSSPVLTQVEVQIDGVDVDEIYPPAPYSIFAGSQSVIGGQYADPGQADITLTGEVAGNDTSFTYGPFQFTDGDTTSYSFVPRMWAIRKIDHWLAWMSVYGEDQDIIDMIVDLSLQYGILTPYTGFNVPVEEIYSLTANASRATNGIEVTWQVTPADADLTFDVYRSEHNSQAWIKLNSRPLRRYSYTDRTALPDVRYAYRVQVVSGDTPLNYAETGEVMAGGDRAELSAFPNPFNAATRIRYTLDQRLHVELAVYDMLGREVEVLVDETRQPGRHSVDFNAAKLASGTYFVRLSARNNNQEPVINRVSRINLVK